MIPLKLVERREELTRQLDVQQHEVWLHEEALKTTKAEIVRLATRLGDLDFAIAAYEEASGGAVGAETASAAAVAPKAADFAPAASARTRAPKRDIRGMVLRHVECDGRDAVRPKAIAAALVVPDSAVHAAIAHWRLKGKLALNTDGTIRLAEQPPEGEPEADNTTETEGNPSEMAGQSATPSELTAWLERVAAADEAASSEASATARSPEPLTLVEFLRATPDSTIAELHAAGFNAPDVWRAQTAGIVTGRKVGDGATVLYSLAEQVEQEAAE